MGYNNRDMDIRTSYFATQAMVDAVLRLTGDAKNSWVIAAAGSQFRGTYDGSNFTVEVLSVYEYAEARGEEFLMRVKNEYAPKDFFFYEVFGDDGLSRTLDESGFFRASEDEVKRVLDYFHARKEKGDAKVVLLDCGIEEVQRMKAVVSVYSSYCVLDVVEKRRFGWFHRDDERTLIPDGAHDILTDYAREVWVKEQVFFQMGFTFTE